MEIIDWIKEDNKNSYVAHYLIEAMSRVAMVNLKNLKILILNLCK